jgi:hypothetical protein
VITDRTRPRPNQPGKHAQVYLHRWVMEQWLGRHLEPHEVVRHTCDNPPCFLFDHLVLGTQQDNIQDMIKKGRARHDNNAHGSVHHNAKLTEADIPEIRRLYDAGVSAKEIGEMFGVTRENIYFIGKRRAWKHVEE